MPANYPRPSSSPPAYIVLCSGVRACSPPFGWAGRLIQYRKVSGHSSGTATVQHQRKLQRAMSVSRSPSNGALLGGASDRDYGGGYGREQSNAELLLGDGGSSSSGGNAFVLEGGGPSPMAAGGGLSAAAALERAYATPAKPRGGVLLAGGSAAAAAVAAAHAAADANGEAAGGRRAPLASPTDGFTHVGPLASPLMMMSPMLGALGGGGGGGGLPFATPAHTSKLVERVRDLTAREAELCARVASMARELEAGAPRGTPSAEVARLLRSAAEEASALQAAHRALSARCDALEERVAYYESELRRANADTTRLRGQLKEEKRKGEKLFASLDVEKEANATAQVALQDLKARLTSYASASSTAAAAGGGGGSGGGGVYAPPSLGGSGGGGGLADQRGGTSTAAITEALQRSASRGSFVFSPGQQQQLQQQHLQQQQGLGLGGSAMAATAAASVGLGSPPALARGSFASSSQRQLLAAAASRQREGLAREPPQAFFSPTSAAASTPPPPPLPQ